MNNSILSNIKTFDTCLIGGGLAGLSAAILLAKSGHSVALFEKETYPFHKVCGEYISLESRDFLIGLGLPYPALKLPQIKNLVVSAPNGNFLRQPLTVGGFGISRYLLDNELKKLALSAGVTIFEATKVLDIQQNKEGFELKTSKDSFYSLTCLGTFGKRSSFDVQWNRPFISQKASKINNLVAVKYHIKTEGEFETIAIHQFRYGYCGVSAIEDNKYCLCYLTRAAELKAHANIEAFEKAVLWQNPHLAKLLSTCTHLFQKPLTIAQVSFQKKSQVENGVLLLGDAAGLIAPLCGNGMSMAMNAGNIAAEIIHQFLNRKITRQTMENAYQQQWNKTFNNRLQAGRLLQSLFDNPQLSNLFVATVKKMPNLAKWLIKQTHGEPF